MSNPWGLFVFSIRESLEEPGTVNLGEPREEPICQEERSRGDNLMLESLLTFTFTVQPCAPGPAIFTETYPCQPLKHFTRQLCKREKWLCQGTIWKGGLGEKNAQLGSLWFQILCQGSMTCLGKSAGQKAEWCSASLPEHFTVRPFLLSCKAGTTVAQGPQG